MDDPTGRTLASEPTFTTQPPPGASRSVGTAATVSTQGATTFVA